MVALPKFPDDIEYATALIQKKRRAYSMPLGDIIQRRIEAKHAAVLRLDYRTPRRVPLASYPLMPWLLRQEALYRQVEKTQPAAQHSQPIEHPVYRVYHFHWGELPHNLVGDLIFKAISFIGSFFDAWAAVRA